MIPTNSSLKKFVGSRISAKEEHLNLLAQHGAKTSQSGGIHGDECHTETSAFLEETGWKGFSENPGGDIFSLLGDDDDVDELSHADALAVHSLVSVHTHLAVKKSAKGHQRHHGVHQRKHQAGEHSPKKEHGSPEKEMRATEESILNAARDIIAMQTSSAAAEEAEDVRPLRRRATIMADAAVKYVTSDARVRGVFALCERMALNSLSSAPMSADAPPSQCPGTAWAINLKESSQRVAEVYSHLARFVGRVLSCASPNGQGGCDADAAVKGGYTNVMVLDAHLKTIVESASMLARTLELAQSAAQTAQSLFAIDGASLDELSARKQAVFLDDALALLEELLALLLGVYRDEAYVDAYYAMLRECQNAAASAVTRLEETMDVSSLSWDALEAGNAAAVADGTALCRELYEVLFDEGTQYNTIVMRRAFHLTTQSRNLSDNLQAWRARCLALHMGLQQAGYREPPRAKEVLSAVAKNIFFGGTSGRRHTQESARITMAEWLENVSGVAASVKGTLARPVRFFSSQVTAAAVSGCVSGLTASLYVAWTAGLAGNTRFLVPYVAVAAITRGTAAAAIARVVVAVRSGGGGDGGSAISRSAQRLHDIFKEQKSRPQREAAAAASSSLVERTSLPVAVVAGEEPKNLWVEALLRSRIGWGMAYVDPTRLTKNLPAVAAASLYIASNIIQAQCMGGDIKSAPDLFVRPLFEAMKRANIELESPLGGGDDRSKVLARDALLVEELSGELSKNSVAFTAWQFMLNPSDGTAYGSLWAQLSLPAMLLDSATVVPGVLDSVEREEWLKFETPEQTAANMEEYLKRLCWALPEDIWTEGVDARGADAYLRQMCLMNAGGSSLVGVEGGHVVDTRRLAIAWSGYIAAHTVGALSPFWQLVSGMQHYLSWGFAWFFRWSTADLQDTCAAQARISFASAAAYLPSLTHALWFVGGVAFIVGATAAARALTMRMFEIRHHESGEPHPPAEKTASWVLETYLQHARAESMARHAILSASAAAAFGSTADVARIARDGYDDASAMPRPAKALFERWHDIPSAASLPKKLSADVAMSRWYEAMVDFEVGKIKKMSKILEKE